MQTLRTIFRWISLPLFVTLLCVGFLSRQPSPDKWKKLAELRDNSGNRFVVAQEHYDFAEGWRASFTVVSSDKKTYGSLLEMETRPWRNVRLERSDDDVKIWRSQELVGMLTLTNNIFTNYLNHAFDKYVDGYNGVQGGIATIKLFFD
jgi:hypothetical protein